MSARVAAGGGTANVATGMPVLDHLLDAPGAERAVRARARAAAGRRRGGGRATPAARSARRSRRCCAPTARPATASAFLPADEALAQVVLEVSDRPLVASNVDLTEARAGGLGSDLAARFLERSPTPPG